MTFLVIAVFLVAVVVFLAATHVFGLAPRRLAHRFLGHPDEARWEGDYTGGCTVGLRACGDVWETEDPR